SLAMDTSVDFTKAITSLPGRSPSSRTERVVMTEVTMPAAVCTSISDSTSPSMISLMVPLNWLRTLMALMVMVFSSERWVSERPAQLRGQRNRGRVVLHRAGRRRLAWASFRFTAGWRPVPGQSRRARPLRQAGRPGCGARSSRSWRSPVRSFSGCHLLSRIAGRVRRGSGVTATGGEGTAGLLDAPLGAGEPFTELSRLNRPRTTRQTGQELIEGGIQPRPQGRRQHRALVFPGNLGIIGIHALQQLLGL